MTDETPTTDEPAIAPRPRRVAARAAVTPDPAPALVPVTSIVQLAPAAAPSIVRLERGGIQEAVADTVEVRMGGIGRLHAEQVSVQLGGIGAARADRITVERGSVGAALAGEVTVTQGMATTVVAREARIGQGYVRTLLAGTVVIERPSLVGLLIARRVSGDVRPLLDWRGALAAGAAVAVVMSVLRGRRSRD